MATIMCTVTLKRALSGVGESPKLRDAQAVEGARLESWAATRIRTRNRDFVVALNERTCVTVVFPLGRVRTFRRDFATALGLTLADRGVSRRQISRECARLEAEPLAPLRDRTLKDAIEWAAFIAGVEIGCESNLRLVAWNLNDLPHRHVTPCIPAEGVRQLFRVRSRPRMPRFGSQRPRAAGY